MDINCRQKFSKGSLVSVSVFPKTVLYSPCGAFPIIRNYVAYGFDNIEDFFDVNNLHYHKEELIKSLEEPFTGIIVDVNDYKLIKPHKTYSLHIFYKIFIDLKKKQYWFSETDLKILDY